MKDEITTGKLRSFGVTVGGIFAFIAFWPVVLQRDDPRWWAMVVAGCLLAPAVAFPSSLSWLYKSWMALGNVLGWINTRIILGIIFYVIITPIGIFRRWLGEDPMGRQLRPDLASYRLNRKPRPASHLRRQY